MARKRLRRLRLTKQERAAENIALLLLKFPAKDRASIVGEAWHMIERAAHGWWNLIGAPHFTARMARLKLRLKK